MEKGLKRVIVVFIACLLMVSGCLSLVYAEPDSDRSSETKELADLSVDEEKVLEGPSEMNPLTGSEEDNPIEMELQEDAETNDLPDTSLVEVSESSDSLISTESEVSVDVQTVQEGENAGLGDADAVKTPTQKPTKKPTPTPTRKPTPKPTKKPTPTPKQTQSKETVTMFRMYNPNSGEHFYTGNVHEKQFLIREGWDYEGVGWVAPKKSSVPVYRLYNPNSGEHHYTSSVKERDWLRKLGWSYEGVGWHSDIYKKVPVYRHYNDHQRSGNHHYTTSKGESDYICANQGWKYEGIGWYACKMGSTTPAKTSIRIGIAWGYDPATISLYQRSIQNAGGMPVILPRADSYEHAKGLVGSVDGIVVTGGGDVHPSFYGEGNIYCTYINVDRDYSDSYIIRAAYDLNKPLLGICRGFQVMNVAFNTTGTIYGSLYQDIRLQGASSYNHLTGGSGAGDIYTLKHGFNPVSGTQVSQIFGSGNFNVSTAHHQGIKQLDSTHFTASGYAIEPGGVNRNVIEGIEATDKLFFVGLEFHPEGHAANGNGFFLSPFRKLVQCARFS